MTVQDQQIATLAYKHVKEDVILILLMGRKEYIDDKIKNINDIIVSTGRGKVGLFQETENNIRIIYNSCMNSVLGIE